MSFFDKYNKIILQLNLYHHNLLNISKKFFGDDANNLNHNHKK